MPMWWQRWTEPRIVRGLLIVLAAAYAAGHVAALFTENVNWDEYALLDRVNKSLLSGDLQAGGRPGLAVLVLMPFVDGCADTMGTVHAARIAWSGFTFALLAGLFVLARMAIQRTPDATAVAGLVTLLFACTPVFLRWSLHVRTDQPAIAAVVWGGAALLASRDRARWSFATGALFATGYLFSQKAVYAVALAGVVALGDLLIEGTRPALRVIAYRALGTLAGALVVLAAYKLLLPLFFAPPATTSLEAGMNLFEWYRWILRYRLYGAMVSSIYPQLALMLLLVGALWVAARRRRDEHKRPLLVAMGVLAVGAAVARFHTASFPYFWITIGLFPAVAIALGWSGIRAWLPRAHVAIGVVAALAAIVLAVRFRLETLADTQEVQRTTFGVVDRLPAHLRGFHPDGALVCRVDPDPLPVYLGQHIQARFNQAGTAATDAFIADFKRRPVAFLVETFRFRMFPPAIRTFWDATYLPYAGAVRLAGARIATARDVEIVVAGRYRWRGTGRVTVGGRELGDGDAVELSAGAVAVAPVGAASGTLWLAIDDPPGATSPLFYEDIAVQEMGGYRSDWW